MTESVEKLTKQVQRLIIVLAILIVGFAVVAFQLFRIGDLSLNKEINLSEDITNQLQGLKKDVLTSQKQLDTLLFQMVYDKEMLRDINYSIDSTRESIKRQMYREQVQLLELHKDFIEEVKRKNDIRVEAGKFLPID